MFTSISTVVKISPPQYLNKLFTDDDDDNGSLQLKVCEKFKQLKTLCSYVFCVSICDDKNNNNNTTLHVCMCLCL
jgi:hypothetical protein